MHDHAEPHEITTENQPWYLRFNLVGALAIIIFMALIIVAVGYGLYWNSKDRKYDIARGGDLSENKALTIEDSESDRTSPVDPPATKQKLEYLQKEINALNSIGSFNPEDLSDQNLQLISPNQPSL
jgi:hypothetical protein